MKTAIVTGCIDAIPLSQIGKLKNVQETPEDLPFYYGQIKGREECDFYFYDGIPVIDKIYETFLNDVNCTVGSTNVFIIVDVQPLITWKAKESWMNYLLGDQTGTEVVVDKEVLTTLVHAQRKLYNILVHNNNGRLNGGCFIIFNSQHEDDKTKDTVRAEFIGAGGSSYHFYVTDTPLQKIFEVIK